MTPTIFMKKAKDYLFMHSISAGLFNSWSDEKFLKMFFRRNMGYEPDLENPKSFSEKLQWLKLHDRKPIYTTMVDKYEAKKYVASIIGEEYIVPTYGVWDHFDDIDFDALPNQFVLKCTHDSGGLVICKDKNKFDFEAAKKKIEKKLSRNYFCIGREWPYKDVQRRIIAETFISDIAQNDTRDYKLLCFNGKVQCFMIVFDRFVNQRANWYDRDGKLLPYGRASSPPDPQRGIEVPPEIEQMVILAEKLSENIPFVRVDFYCVNKKIYFGELTFYPASGLSPFTDEAWDMQLGSWLQLP